MDSKECNMKLFHKTIRFYKYLISYVSSQIKLPSIDKAERIFFCICFCSTIAYAPSLIIVLMSMLMPHTLLHYFILSFVLVCVCVCVLVSLD